MSNQFDNLQSLKYSELRKIAKTLGIKNKAKAEILEGIARASHLPPSPEPSEATSRATTQVTRSAARRRKGRSHLAAASPNNEPSFSTEEEAPTPAKIRKLPQVKESHTPVVVAPMPRTATSTKRRKTGVVMPMLSPLEHKDPEKESPAQLKKVLTPTMSTRRSSRKSTPVPPILKSSKRRTLRHRVLSPITSSPTKPATEEMKNANITPVGRRSELGSTPRTLSSRRTSRRKTGALSPIPSPTTTKAPTEPLAETPPPQSSTPKGKAAKKTSSQEKTQLTPISETLQQENGPRQPEPEEEETFFSFKLSSSSSPKRRKNSRKASTPKASAAATRKSSGRNEQQTTDDPSMQLRQVAPTSPKEQASLSTMVESLSPIPSMAPLELNTTVTLESVEDKENQKVKKQPAQVRRFSPRLATLGQARAIVTPNFTKLHQRNFEKMESLDEYINRKNKLKTKIPKLVPREQQPAFVPSVLKASKANTNFTGASRSRNNNKKKAAPVYKFEGGGGSNISLNNSSSTNLLNSSFHKRMTFDLQASLTKKLNYQPHRGKLKPTANRPEEVHVQKRRAETRDLLHGVRTNRRFDLIMKNRNA